MPKNNHRRNKEKRENAAQNLIDEAMRKWLEGYIEPPRQVVPPKGYQFSPEDLEASQESKQRNMEALQRFYDSIAFEDDDGVKWFAPIPEADSNQLGCLGVPPNAMDHGFENQVNLVKNSQYAKLRRPLYAPCKCRIVTGDAVEQELVFKFWRGEFSASFIEEYSIEVDTSGLEALLSHAYFLRAAVNYEDSDGKNQQCIFSSKANFCCQNAIDRKEILQLASTFNGSIFGSLDSKDFKILECRIVHQLLRKHGWMLAEKALTGLVKRAAAPFLGTKKYAAAFLDLRITYVDILMNRPFDYKGECISVEDISHEVRVVGQALESTPKNDGEEPIHYFREATNLHVENAERFSQNNAKGEVVNYNAASGCALNNMQYRESLEYAIRSLHSLERDPECEQWDFSNKIAKKLVENFLISLREYDNLVMKYTHLGRGEYVPNDEEKAYYGLQALFLCSKFRPDNSIVHAESWHQCSMQPIETLLRPLYRRPDEARRALIRIFKSSFSWDEMISHVLPTMFPINSPWKKIVCAYRVQEGHLKTNRERARSILSAYAEDISCANCGKSYHPCDKHSKHLTCSRCLSIHYCSIKCQREHWGAHKKVCKKKEG